MTQNQCLPRTHRNIISTYIHIKYYFTKKTWNHRSANSKLPFEVKQVTNDSVISMYTVVCCHVPL